MRQDMSAYTGEDTEAEDGGSVQREGGGSQVWRWSEQSHQYMVQSHWTRLTGSEAVPLTPCTVSRWSAVQQKKLGS